ncbi:GATA transcription factor 4-like [Curcuma longa]|uniref:GATA transcription factor 4-like n=1 Tax=Curcuma longa TaxID=136217 RepID=UPI003D9E34C7
MAPEREMPAADCYSANFVSASLLPPPNQSDTSLAAAAASVRFPSVSGQGVSDLYSAAEKSGTAGSSSLSTAFQAEQTSLDLYVPQCEDEAELEWLSRFMEESTFCDVPDIAPPRSGAAERTDIGRKRPRSTAWASLALSSPSSSSSSSNEFFSDGSGRRKKGSGSGAAPRRCTHCESEKTPQWRTGPLGPKTLCNACGVRYKSGRLVPEYRPAASPTFVLMQHSNSHRRVMELRRQKELFLLLRPQHSNPDASSAAQPPLGSVNNVSTN